MVSKCRACLICGPLILRRTLDAVSTRKTEVLVGFFNWHQRQTEQLIARLGITPYQALWWAWGKGIVLGAIGYWWLLG